MYDNLKDSIERAESLVEFKPAEATEKLARSYAVAYFYSPPVIIIPTGEMSDENFGAVLQSVITAPVLAKSLAMNFEKNIKDAFLDGYLKALYDFAWWKDGTMYVGAGIKTYKEVADKIIKEYGAKDERPD